MKPQKMPNAMQAMLPRYMHNYSAAQRTATVQHYMAYSLAKLRRWQRVTAEQIRSAHERRIEPALQSLQAQYDLLSAAVGERYCPME